MTKIEPRKPSKVSSDVAPRSLPTGEWPEADRLAWQDACRPSVRLQRGGSASHLAEVSRKDFVGRYGAFLGCLQRAGLLDLQAAAGAQVTSSHVDLYINELKNRVSSVTIWNCIYKLRRAAELINPKAN